MTLPSSTVTAPPLRPKRRLIVLSTVLGALLAPSAVYVGTGGGSWSVMAAQLVSPLAVIAACVGAGSLLPGWPHRFVALSALAGFLVSLAWQFIAPSGASMLAMMATGSASIASLPGLNLGILEGLEPKTTLPASFVSTESEPEPEPDPQASTDEVSGLSEDRDPA